MRSLITPKKKFGQNFLQDKGILQRVSTVYHDLVESHNIDSIIEIGPGQGDYTDILLDVQLPVTAIEIDTEAYDYLLRKYNGDRYCNLTLVHADAYQLLSTQHSEFIKPNTALFANLPFNVGSRILVDLPIYAPSTLFSVVLQREVAQKVSSQAGITLFGAWLRMMYTLRIEFAIPRSAFYPQPNVTSALLTGVPKPVSAEISRQKLFSLLKLLFRMPNKTLKNNMRGVFGQRQIELVYKETHWPEDVRLTWDNYEEIVQVLYQYYEV